MEDFKTLFKLAQQNDPSAQLDLAYCYFRGEGVEQNIAEAIRWWRTLAETPDLSDKDREYTDEEYDNYQNAFWHIALAQYELGYLYYNGIGVEKDYEEAAKWFERSVWNNGVHAKYELAKCYYFGHGVEQNSEKALEFLKSAAKDMHPDAINHLEMWYEGDFEG